MSLLPGPKMAASQPTNLNHLLNFSLPPRQPHPLSTPCRRSRKTGTAHGTWNKERELVVSCLSSGLFTLDRLCQRSVSLCHESEWRLYCTFCRSRHVSPLSRSLEATHHRVAHSFFQWSDILQVIIPRSPVLASASATLLPQDDSQTNCPICLSPPAAPRMTRCGHVGRSSLSLGSQVLIFLLDILLSLHPALFRDFRQQVGPMSDLFRLSQ